jgi:hypothetical protein
LGAAWSQLIPSWSEPVSRDASIMRRTSAAEIDAAVVAQMRDLLSQPEIVVGTWLGTRIEAPELKEGEVREALARLDPLWGELFPRSRRGSCGHWWSGWSSARPAPTSGCGWMGSAVSSATSPPSGRMP